MENYGLDLHCSMILDDFRDLQPTYEAVKETAVRTLKAVLKENGIYINALESRIKAEKSLAGKLELKGHKYADITQITDLVGVRVITFFEDEVDKIAALVGKVFDIDWENSVDKRKMHKLDSFGYGSLHYICRIPESLYSDPAFPQLNTVRFEIQMRTALQHVWATFNHDSGYKGDIEIPQEYLREMYRLASLMELADEQFSKLRSDITDYCRKIQSLLSEGKFDEVPLDVENFRNLLKTQPFNNLNKRIAAINQAEISEISLMSYYEPLRSLGFKTLADVLKLISDHSEDAYQMAVYEFGNTDIDIIISSVGIQNLLITHILKEGGREAELTCFFDSVYGESDYNSTRAAKAIATANKLGLL